MDYGSPDQFKDWKLWQSKYTDGMVKIEDQKFSMHGEQWNASLKYQLNCTLESDNRFGSIILSDVREEEIGDDFISGIFKIDKDIISLCFNERPKEQGVPTSLSPRPKSFDTYIAFQRISE